jgi:histidinol-phosphate phosphatase family protein
MFLNAGIYILKRHILRQILDPGIFALAVRQWEGKQLSLDGDLIPMLLDNKQAITFVKVRQVHDVGTLNQYIAAKRFVAASSTSSANVKALFLDRDGVLIPPLRRGTYHTRLDQMVPNQDVEELVRTAKMLGYATIQISNQGHAIKGQNPRDSSAGVTLAEAEAMEQEVAHRFDLSYSLVCYHSARYQCLCRKPLPGMLLKAERLLGLNLAASVMIGDSYADCRAATAAGVRPIILQHLYNADDCTMIAQRHPNVRFIRHPLEAIQYL